MGDNKIRPKASLGTSERYSSIRTYWLRIWSFFFLPVEFGPVWAAGEAQPQWNRGCVWSAGWAPQHWAPKEEPEPSSSLSTSVLRLRLCDTAPWLSAEQAHTPGRHGRKIQQSKNGQTAAIENNHNNSFSLTPSLWSLCAPRGESVSMQSSSSALSSVWLT